MKRTLRFVATLLTLCLLVGIPSVSASYFADVSTDSLDRETFDAINYVSDNGWITGTSSTTFSPNNLLNRAMFVTILYRMSGSSEKFAAALRMYPPRPTIMTPSAGPPITASSTALAKRNLRPTTT